MGQKRQNQGSKRERDSRNKHPNPRAFLLIDFSNISEWEVGTISALYKKHSIAHTQLGEKLDSENFCCTRRKTKWRYYFREEDVDYSLGRSVTKKYYLSPLRSGYDEIFVMLKESQSEYRAFLDGCIAGRFDLLFLNERMARIPSEFTWGSKSYWTPEIVPVQPLLPDIESYIDWEIVKTARAEKGPQVFGKLRKCRMCKRYLIYERETKKSCNAKCRAAYHRMTHGDEIAKVKRQRRAEGKDQ